jgi:hypothetical protein
MEAILAAFTALILGVPIVAGAISSGQQERLCQALGGTYTPAPFQQNVCPGGSWGKFWSSVRPPRS